MIITESIFASVTPQVHDKTYYLKGVFLEAEQRNRNGRVYPLDAISTAVNKFNFAAQSGHPVLGELDHPVDHTDISLKNVSHCIQEMQMDGNNGVGVIKILESTPAGQIARSLLAEGLQLGVSSRGTGKLDSNNRVAGFNCITIDIVAQPSAINAYPETIQESLEMYKRGMVVNDLAESVIHDINAQKYFAAEIKKFIASLRN